MPMMRNIIAAHDADITVCEFSYELGLIVTVGIGMLVWCVRVCVCFFFVWWCVRCVRVCVFLVWWWCVCAV